MKRPYIYNVMYACMGLALLAACSEENEVPASSPKDGETVSFSTAMEQSAATRVTTGMVRDLDGLKDMTEGFGVFAYLTEENSFATKFPTTPASANPSKEKSVYASFADFFMQNEQVTWRSAWAEKDANGKIKTDKDGLEIWHKDWVYEPLKYWPNYSDNNNAHARNISFFAYAPWADKATTPAAGVVDYTRDADRTPHVIYKTGAADQQVDLLWANAMDAKRNGQGLISVGRNKADDADSLVYQKVPLYFKHALSAIDIYMQRVYDEPAYTGKTPEELFLYPRLFISKLELASTTGTDAYNGLQKTGKLSLIDGTWEDPGAPYAWVASGSEVKITYDETMFNDTVRGTANPAEDFIRDAELDKWKWIFDTKNTAAADDDEWTDASAITQEDFDAPANADRWTSIYGVNNEERNLLKNSMTQVLIPRKVTLIPTLTYSMVTRDDNLHIGYLTDSDGHKYNRIVNEVAGNSVTLDLVAGKRYTLLIRIGVEHVTFELVSVVDWDFPMRFTPDVVTDFENEDIGHIVNE